MPADQDEAGLALPTDYDTTPDGYVKSITYGFVDANNGTLTVLFDGTRLGLGADVDLVFLGTTTIAGGVSWDCTVAQGGSLIAKYRPANCR